MLPALFLCRQDGLEQNVPLLPHMYDGDDPSLHLLHIKYINTPGDLQRLASCLHLLPGAYSAIVVEDVNSVVRGDDRNALVRTLALLLDGVRSYRTASGCGTRCQLLVTDSSDEARRPRYIYDRWLPTVVLLSPSTLPAGPDGSFTLTVASSSSSSSSSSGGHYSADARPTATTADAPDAATAHHPPADIRCWYRPSGGRLVLEAVQGPERPGVRILPYNGFARCAAGSQGAMAIG